MAFGVNNFPGGFASGITIRGMPIAVAHPGKVFWVSNATTLSDRQINGSDNNKGTFDQPFATIAGAIAQCVANRGDIVYVKPGHAESITAAGSISLNKAGVAIVGLGVGSYRPTLTWSTVAGANIQVSANNIFFSNFLCISTMATGFTTSAFAVLTTVVANDLTIDNCEFRDSSATTGFLAIMTQGCLLNSYVLRILQDTGPVFGANSQTALRIAGNRTYSNNTGTTAGELFSGGSTASNELVSDNYSWHLAATGLLGPISTKLAFAQNYCSITGTADKQPLQNPLLV